jgi:hypothetical protein
MIAMESKYHPACILSFYRKAAAVQNEINVEMDDAVSPHVNAESLALAEVIAYMEDMRLVEVTPTVFKLSELCQLYCNHLEKLDVPVTSKVHASRIKERILDNYPAVTAVPHGRDVLLTFGEHVGAALLSISQLLMFNVIKRRRRQMTADESLSTVVRHVENRETPTRRPKVKMKMQMQFI